MNKPDWRRAKLLQDGRKALELQTKGIGPSDALMAIGGSRARLYRAIDYARQTDKTTDPLLD